MINGNRPQHWKADTQASVDLYNDWFIQSAPQAFRESRANATVFVEQAFKATDYLRDITPANLRVNPAILPVLRMSTCPPLAVDRLIGLSGVAKGLVAGIEKRGVIGRSASDEQLAQLVAVIDKLLDRPLFPWLEAATPPGRLDAYRAATIVADRYCGALANPIIRNAQESRQLSYIEAWLLNRGYTKLTKGVTLQAMPAGSFAFRMNVPVSQGQTLVNIPVDAVIKPQTANPTDLPLLIEAKSAGDFTNTNKRRKEEVQKFTMLKHTYGPHLRFVLFLCGYFDAPYLGYSAAEGIDWVWEHRIDDFLQLGL